MSLLYDLAYVMTHGVKNVGDGNITYQVYESNIPSEVKGEVEPQNMLSVYTACKKLSESISQMDIQVTKDDVDYKDFPKYYELRYRMNSLQNNQVFWSTVEYHRNIYGNAFIDIRKNKNEIIHPSLIADYDFKGPGETLRFQIVWSGQNAILQEKYKSKRPDEWINNEDVLHFKGMSVDGVFGLPPVTAAAQAMNIMDKASNTVISFYKNRALSPMALESTINTAAGAKATIEGIEVFNKKYAGTYNAGKTMQLPPNTKLTPLAIQFRDAELVETMKFTKEEIMGMYGIPTYMYASTNELQGDIEQQTLSFKTFTLAPIAKVYEEEISFKLLSKQERIDNVKVSLNMDALIASDLKSKAVAYRGLVTAGILTLNAAAKAMGFPESEHPNMDMHYIQTQNIPIEKYDEFSVVSPDAKTNKNTETEEKKEDE